MNFFEHQAVARKQTGRLVVLFCLAVLGIIAAVYLLVAVVFIGVGESQSGPAFWQPQLLAIVAVITVIVVGISSLGKIAQLRGGGRTIAQSLGGRLLTPDATDLVERRVLNVVEEMAIASGVPVPPVYFMDSETGINAFAAGYGPTDAVIGVTRGCAERLSRDELQGVIAHEFSHILNGDMRLNIRLIGLLFGIMVIGFIGHFIIRSLFYTGGYHHRRSSSDRNNPFPLLALGAGLIAIGAIGSFFGSWIKAAVSRQREFLADSSAVQFTRNPDGIGGALKKIGGFITGAKIASPNAPEASHMFFGQALTSGFNAMFATHPPLQKRIARIDPGWDGEFVASEAAPQPVDAAAHPSHAVSMAVAAGPQAVAMMSPPDTPPPAVQSIGQPAPWHVERAGELLGKLHPPFAMAARETYGARAVIYVLLLNHDGAARRAQIARLQAEADAGVFKLTTRLAGEADRIEPEHRIVLLDLALPALRRLSPSQYRSFRENVQSLIEADDHLALFEWSLRRILLRHLDDQFGPPRSRQIHYYSLSGLKRELELVLSILAYLGHRDLDSARHAFSAGDAQLSVVDLSMLPADQCEFDTLDEALDRLARVKPHLKESVMLACAACIGADHEVTPEEAELFRAFGESLGCPVPPLMPGQRLA